jgi:hypothetical protein
MRTAWIGLAVVVAIGLIWSVAAMSKRVPVNSAEMQVGLQQGDSAVTVGMGNHPK